jgi:hypothetical protein
MFKNGNCHYVFQSSEDIFKSSGDTANVFKQKMSVFSKVRVRLLEERHATMRQLSRINTQIPGNDYPPVVEVGRRLTSPSTMMVKMSQAFYSSNGDQKTINNSQEGTTNPIERKTDWHCTPGKKLTPASTSRPGPASTTLSSIVIVKLVTDFLYRQP